MPAPVLTRRRVLGLAAGALLAAGCSPAVTAPPGAAPGEPDPLLALVAAARDDAARAGASTATLPGSADALTAVAALRTAHADALAAEVDRAAGGPTTTTLTSSTSAPAAPLPFGSLDEVRAALAAASGAAGALAVTAPAYRAGLLGSVAAACTAAPGML